MHILRGSLTSPFVRQIRVAITVLDLADRIRFKAADAFDPADSIRRQNPLGKIPTLILEDASAIYDSRVILEYLDCLAGGGLIIPREFKDRFDALRLQALANGILDAAVLLVQENRFRSVEKRELKWIEHQSERVERALAVLEKAPPKTLNTINVGDIALACAIDWLDLRFDRMCSKDYPKLMEWLREFTRCVPHFIESKP